MKQWISLFSALFVVILLATQCSSESVGHRHAYLKDWLKDNGKVKTLTTTCMIGDLVHQVGGEYVDNLCLIASDLDPHSYQLVKGDDEKLQFAQIIFANGLGLEHGPSLHQYLSNSEKTVSIGDEIAKGAPQIVLTYQGQTDPHIWMDISIWMRALPIVVQALSDHDPAHADIFRANAEKLYKDMEKAHQETREALLAVPDNKRFLVTSHDAFNYFARAYLGSDAEIANDTWSKRFQAPEGLAPDSQLSSRHIQEILEHLTKYKIHVIFPESNLSKDSIRKLVQAGNEEGLKLSISDDPLYGDAMGPPGSDGDSYLKMIDHDRRVLVQHLNNQPENQE
jgi:manganese/zinc/iron transport system substrate-binding protein